MTDRTRIWSLRLLSILLVVILVRLLKTYPPPPPEMEIVILIVILLIPLIWLHSELKYWRANKETPHIKPKVPSSLPSLPIFRDTSFDLPSLPLPKFEDIPVTLPIQRDPYSYRRAAMRHVNLGDSNAARLAVRWSTASYFIYVFILWILRSSIGPDHAMLIALEILGYGVIITLAIWYLMVARVKDRMAIPTLSAGVAFLGCLTYALLSSDNGHFWHFFSAGLLLAGLLLVKGLAGPLASGIILSLATYGLLHGTGSHIPLVQQLVMFVFGEVHLAIEYIAVIIMVLVSAVSTAVSLNDLFDFF